MITDYKFPCFCQNRLNISTSTANSDVQELYSKIKKTLLIKAIEIAFPERKHYGKVVRTLLMRLSDFDLKNVIIQYLNKFYNQYNGMITRDNYSVLFVNAALHYVVCQVSANAEHGEIFKRFTGDIVWLSFGNQAIQNMKTKLLETLLNMI